MDNILSLIMRARAEGIENVTKMSKSFDALGYSAKNAHGSASTLSSVLSGIGAGVGIVGVMGVANATARLVDILGDATRAAMEDEASVRKLTQTLRENAPAWSGSLVAVERFVRAGQQLAFTDDAIREAVGKLTVSTGDVGRAMDLTRLAMDLARLKGIDLATATDYINKALGGQIGALRRVLPFIDANATSTQALAAIQRAAQGQAESYAATTEGSVLRSQIELNEALEKLGYITMPLVADAADNLSGAIDLLADVMDTLTGATEDAGDEAVQGAGHFNDLGTALGNVFKLITFSPIPGLISELDKLFGSSEHVRVSLDGAAVSAKYLAINASGSIAPLAAYNGTLGRMWDTADGAWLALRRLHLEMGAGAVPVTVLSNGMTAYGKTAADVTRANSDAVLSQRAWLDSIKKTTSASSGAVAGIDKMAQAAEKLASKLRTQVSDAFQRFKDAALDALDAAHEKALRAIDDAQRLADAQYEAARAAIQGPVDAARAALDAARAARQLTDAQNDLNEAYASGDAQRIESAARRLADLQADAAIDALEREADAKLAALAETKAAEDQARADAEKAEELSYADKKKAMEADLDLIETQLDALAEKYEGKTRDLITALKGYSADFTALGKSMGVDIATGAVEGLDTLIPKVAAKVAAILESKYELTLKAGATPAAPATPPGMAAGGSVAAWQPYIVGERGRELFVPGVGGTIVPHGTGIGRGGGVNLSVTITGPAIFDPLGIGAQQVAAALLPALKRESARQGVSL